MEAEAFGLARPGPIGARGLQQHIGAGDVRLDKGGGAVDGAVHMAFGRQMHDRVGLVRRQNAVHLRPVADIGLLKGIERVVRDHRHVIEAGRICQLVEVDHMVPSTHGLPHHGGPDEPGPTGHEEFHCASSHTKGLSRSFSRGATASFSDRIGVPSKPQSIPTAGSSQRSAPSVSGA